MKTGHHFVGGSFGNDDIAPGATCGAEVWRHFEGGAAGNGAAAPHTAP